MHFIDLDQHFYCWKFLRMKPGLETQYYKSGRINMVISISYKGILPKIVLLYKMDPSKGYINER